MIELSPEQQKCALAIEKWLLDEDSSQVFYVTGFAGSGKSTVVMQVMTRLGIEHELEVLYAAYTGKAALVMRQKGCPDASTIHKLIYLPAGVKNAQHLTDLKQKLDDKRTEVMQTYGADYHSWDHPDVKDLSRQVKQLEQNAQSPMFRMNLDSPIKYADVVVIDEVSMVGPDLAKDLLSFGTKVLVLGDPGQLPPVAGEGYFTKRTPDFTLTEIHRQAKDSPILMLATRARMGERLIEGTYGNCHVVRQITPAMALEADQILCGRNRTRHVNNARMRQLRGYSGTTPQPGEKLVCLRNNHEKGLLNGSLWSVVRASKYSKSKYSLTVRPEEGGEAITVLAHSAYMEWYGHTDWVDPEGKKTWVDMLEEAVKGIGFEMREAESFVYGSVLTVHKAQGSQWDNVLLLDESPSFGSESRKHLYTGITRAAKTITVRLPVR